MLLHDSELLKCSLLPELLIHKPKPENPNSFSIYGGISLPKASMSCSYLPICKTSIYEGLIRSIRNWIRKNAIPKISNFFLPQAWLHCEVNLSPSRMHVKGSISIPFNPTTGKHILHMNTNHLHWPKHTKHKTITSNSNNKYTQQNRNCEHIFSLLPHSFLQTVVTQHYTKNKQ